MTRRFVFLILMLAALLPATAYTQGVQTGTLTGAVKTTDGARSPRRLSSSRPRRFRGNARRLRTSTASISMPSLPPGHVHHSRYRRRVSPHGADRAPSTRAPSRRSTSLLGGADHRDRARRRRHAAGGHATQMSSNIAASEVNVLPMGRTPYQIAELMPGLTTNTPNRNQFTISGASPTTTCSSSTAST